MYPNGGTEREREKGMHACVRVYVVYIRKYIKVMYLFLFHVHVYSSYSNIQIIKVARNGVLEDRRRHGYRGGRMIV